MLVETKWKPDTETETLDKFMQRSQWQHKNECKGPQKAFGSQASDKYNLEKGWSVL